MSSKFGGGGNKCVICDKTAYPAETIQYEKKPYHVECFRCKTCDKKIENSGKASAFEDTIYCLPCFQKGGFAQKQKNVKWVKKEGGGGTASTKFGGGGNPCTVCQKTVYAAETLSFEKKAYHADCFVCTEEDCGKKLTASGAASFEGRIICRKCFTGKGFNRKQTKTATAGGSTKANSIANRFGGGGNKCTVCNKTVYAAETVSYEKKPYHAECFKCTLCDKKCTPSGAAAFEGDIICTKCFTDKGYNRKQTKQGGTSSGAKTNSAASKFGGGGNKCVRCDKTVYPAETVSFEKTFFHAECFTCLNCNVKCNTSNAEGKKTDAGVEVYCKKCWGELGLNRATVN